MRATYIGFAPRSPSEQVPITISYERLSTPMNLTTSYRGIALSNPLIASLSCVSHTGWVDYARGLQEAGADAIELNIGVTDGPGR